MVSSHLDTEVVDQAYNSSEFRITKSKAAESSLAGLRQIAQQPVHQHNQQARIPQYQEAAETSVSRLSSQAPKPSLKIA